MLALGPLYDEVRGKKSAIISHYSFLLTISTTNRTRMNVGRTLYAILHLEQVSPILFMSCSMQVDDKIAKGMTKRANFLFDGWQFFSRSFHFNFRTRENGGSPNFADNFGVRHVAGSVYDARSTSFKLE